MYKEKHDFEISGFSIHTKCRHVQSQKEYLQEKYHHPPTFLNPNSRLGEEAFTSTESSTRSSRCK